MLIKSFAQQRSRCRRGFLKLLSISRRELMTPNMNNFWLIFCYKLMIHDAIGMDGEGRRY